MSRFVDWLSDRLYKTPESREPTLGFIELLHQYVTPSSMMLDLGAGAGEIDYKDYKLRGRCQKIIGVDLDSRVKTNPLIDEGILCDINDCSFEDGTFDVVFSMYVLEHIDDSSAYVAQVARLLRPGGYFLAITPNRFHYVPLIASITPHRFHEWVNRKRGRSEVDTFPTFYRMNTRRRLESLFESEGFEVILLETVGCRPNYLSLSAPLFLVGALYERLIASCRLFSPLRGTIYCVFRKKNAASESES